jgi:nitrous oxide reductase
MPKNNETPPGISRRDFSRCAAIAAAAGALPRTALAAAETPKSAPADQAEIESKTEAILQRYGDRFSEAQKADIRRLVREGQKPLDAMRKFPLGNADQPGNVLKLYPDPPAAHED